MNRPVLSATIRAALDATGASSGWIVHATGAVPVVVAVGGDTSVTPGRPLLPDAPASLAIATGQPASRSVAIDEVAARGAGGIDGIPGWLLTIPVGDGAGALELAKPTGADAFTIDDIEIVSLLADIAEAALDEAPVVAPSPDDLAAELRSLHAANPARYGVVAAALSSLLGAS